VLGLAAEGEGDTFTGSFVYYRGGKEITETINGRGNRAEAVRGDYVKSCTVQKTSDKQVWIRLVISDEGKKIFESEKIETKDPVVYRKQ
jgi:hypothetical protein